MLALVHATEANIEHLQRSDPNYNSLWHHTFLDWMLRMVREGRDIRHVINKGYGKKHRKRLRELIQQPLDEMALLINDDDGAIATFAKWRLSIGK